MDVQVLGNLDVEGAVKERYSAGAQAREEALCCPVSTTPPSSNYSPPKCIERTTAAATLPAT